QADAAFVQALAQPRKRRRSAEIAVHDVLAHRERRATDVVLRVVDEDLTVFGLPFALRQRDRAASVPRLPHAEEPPPVEPLGRDAIEVGIGDVVERRGASEGLALLPEASAGIDLQQRRPWRMLHHQLAILAVARYVGARPASACRSVSASMEPNI